METLNQVLARIIKAHTTLKKGVEEAQILEIWPLAVGEALGKHTRAIKLKGKTLWVEVDHPVWKQELHSNKMLAIKRMNDKLRELLSDQHVVEDIFLVSGQPKVSQR